MLLMCVLFLASIMYYENIPKILTEDIALVSVAPVMKKYHPVAANLFVWDM